MNLPTAHLWHIWLEFSHFFLRLFTENMKLIKSGSVQDLHFLLCEGIISWELNRIHYFVLLQGNVKFWFVCFLLSFVFVISANIFAFFFSFFSFSRYKSYLMYCNVIYLHYINSRTSPEIEDYVYFFHPYSLFLIIFDIKIIT